MGHEWVQKEKGVLMSHRAIRHVATAVLVLAAILPSGAGDALDLSASYAVSEMKEGVDTVSMTFSFALRTGRHHGQGHPRGPGQG